jgi:hypothetical protein
MTIPQDCYKACPCAATWVSNETANDGADDEPQRARRSTEAKMWRCSALDQLDEPLRGNGVLPA